MFLYSRIIELDKGSLFIKTEIYSFGNGLLVSVSAAVIPSWH